MHAILLLAVAAFAAAGSARAEDEHGLGGPVTATVAPEVAKPKAPAWMFASASAAVAKPLPPQERDERQFLREAAAAVRFESDASRLALAKAGSDNVRSFAATLLKHRAATTTELQYLLQARGMAAPMLANDQRKTLNRLSKLQGAKFDREYMAHVGLKHQKEGVMVFERAARSAQDPQIKAWIDRTLPALRYQLASGEKLAPSGMRQVTYKYRPGELPNASNTR